MSRAPRAPRRFWGEDDTGCTVLHVDMDAFFASVEILDHPELRGRAVVVGGEIRGVVTSATYEARAYGVRSAMPVAQARRLCPHAVLLPTRHERYREVSRDVMAVLAEVTPQMEQVSVDEAFLDVTGAVRRMGAPVEIGAWIRREVRARTGVPASVGVGATKVVAKLASAHAKPDGLLLVPAAATVPFLHALPVGAVPGVGGRTAEVLARHGWHRVADLATATLEELQRAVGPAAAHRLQELARGADPRPVAPGRAEKSVGTETTFAADVRDPAELDRVLLAQSHQCAARLRADGVRGWTVSVKIRFADFRTVTRSRTLAVPTDLAADVVAAARALLGGVPLPAGGVRLLGVRVERLVAGAAGVQATLDDDPHRAEAERVMDSVRARFGTQGLRPGTLVGPPTGPSSGGPEVPAFPPGRGDLS